MMNHNTHPSGPMYHGGRRPQDMSYHQQPQYPPNMYQYHPQHVPQPYHPQPPQQWGYYNMQHHMPRSYQPSYSPMLNGPYPMTQTPSMSPRPLPQHLHSSPSIRSQPTLPSPSPVQHRPLQPPSQASIPLNRPSPPPAPPPLPVADKLPFYPPLPWYSRPEEEFPRSRLRRRRRYAPQSPSLRVELPTRNDDPVQAQAVPSREIPTGTAVASSHEPSQQAETHTINAPSTTETAQDHTATQSTLPGLQQTVIAEEASRSHRKVVPAVPAIPAIPKVPHAATKHTESVVPETLKSTTQHTGNGAAAPAPESASPKASGDPESPFEDGSPSSSQQKITPKSWADLVRRKASISASVPATGDVVSGDKSANPAITAASSKADIFATYNVQHHDEDNKISFLKPRGLVNTGNMCYMNSILQALVFCVPFYDFLEQVRRNAAYSFNTETPMVDAMIMFIREFPVIDSASSPEQLNLRLKDKELEDYGDAFTPDFVYDAIKRLPRFASMRRGHQQDAEEFLGFLLEEMHEECVRVMKGTSTNIDNAASSVRESESSEANGWLEVGPKQKSAITRSAGIVEAESPITKIFGGKLRSEFRVPGAKNSVTLEPYQPLQLDIGSPHINNITEALKGLTRSETIHGDFNSPRGPGVSATKQVFVETLPPVLILHLKRFQYDNAGGTQKIWKKVGYPLELEIPKELFPPHRRGGIQAHGGFPHYRLICVVYHHGKNASGGHYTVDLRRQNDREWIRLDDTVIRRVRSEDVAEAGGEDPKALAAALEQHKRDNPSERANIFDTVRDDAGSPVQSEKGWSQVNGAATHTTKKWTGVVNGADTPNGTSGKRTPVGRSSVKDNKVAYILFYQKIDT